MKIINPKFRPKSYWGPKTLKNFYGSKIKGTIRKKIVLDNLEKNEVPSQILEDELSPKIKESLGRIHPSLMGGEYLPDYLPNEVEICSIVLKTVTLDTISIRARHEDGLIHYRIVDEYYFENEERYSYKIFQNPTKLTLTTKQIIKLIDNIENVMSEDVHQKGIRSFYYELEQHYFENHYDDFVTVNSIFYPELNTYFANFIDDMLYKEMKNYCLNFIKDLIEDKNKIKIMVNWLENYYAKNGKLPHFQKIEEHQVIIKEQKKISEYETNFLNGNITSNEDEKKWRKKNKYKLQELKFNEKVKGHIEKSNWLTFSPTGSPYATIGKQKLFITIKKFVIDYSRKYKKFPSGTHYIGYNKINFPD